MGSSNINCVRKDRLLSLARLVDLWRAVEEVPGLLLTPSAFAAAQAPRGRGRRTVTDSDFITCLAWLAEWLSLAEWPSHSYWLVV